MNTDSTDSLSGIPHLIERQMFLWNARRKAERAKSDTKTDVGFRFLTICNDEGSLGGEIAQELGRRLGWHVFDKEIVNYIAQNSHVRENLVQELDEKSKGLVEETILRLLRMPERPSFGSEEYHRGLVKALAYLSTQGNAILVGRGANFALHKESHGLRVWTYASLGVRIRRLCEERLVSSTEAQQRLLKSDSERRQFIRQHFRQDINDLRFYDLVLNTDFLTTNQAAEAVLSLMRPVQQAAPAQAKAAGAHR